MKAIFEDRNRQYTVQVGDTIVAYGDRSTGIFMCSGVTVSPAK